MSEEDQSFIASLFKKRADVQQIGQSSGANVQGAVSEVDRQITQALRGGDPVKGKGVTKSGKED